MKKINEPKHQIKGNFAKWTDVVKAFNDSQYPAAKIHISQVHSNTKNPYLNANACIYSAIRRHGFHIRNSMRGEWVYLVRTDQEKLQQPQQMQGHFTGWADALKAFKESNFVTARVRINQVQTRTKDPYRNASGRIYNTIRLHGYPIAFSMHGEWIYLEKTGGTEMARKRKSNMACAPQDAAIYTPAILPPPERKPKANERAFMIEFRKMRDVSLNVMAKACECSSGLLRMLEEDRNSVTHPRIARRIAKAYKMTAEQAENLLPINYRPHGGDYDPDRYKTDEHDWHQASCKG